MQKTKMPKKRFFMRLSFFFERAFSPMVRAIFCSASWRSGVGSFARRASILFVVRISTPSIDLLNTSIFLFMYEKKISSMYAALSSSCFAST